jgi:hypothetical protein
VNWPLQTTDSPGVADVAQWMFHQLNAELSPSFAASDEGFLPLAAPDVIARNAAPDDQRPTAPPPP